MRFVSPLKVILTTLIIFSLFGCKPKQMTYLSLMQNPSLLEEKVASCQLDESADCQLIKRAGEDYINLNTQRQENPELFGKLILQAQYALSQTMQELIQAKKLARINPHDQTLQAKIVFLQTNYQLQNDKVKTLLAIVASTSPQ